MKTNLFFRFPLSLLLACGLWLAAGSAFSQDYDTISNWDDISVTWYVSTTGSATVNNPAPDDVNSSPKCLKFITSDGEYDYMFHDLDEPANFSVCPRYKLKVLAPASGGNITLKFENSNNTFSQEIVMPAVAGQWADIEYDFSGLPYDNFVRMVIFPDFQGTTPDIKWYIDDVLRESCPEPPPLELESNLPIIVINSDSEIPDEPKITAHMGIIDNGPGNMNNLNDPYNNYDGLVGIEIRGQSSQMFPKHSYGFETRDADGENLDAELLGLPYENDWVLYAPYSDKSLLRNIMSFEMGRRMDEYCTRSRMCELVINGDYKGIYTLMEKIKQDSNRVDIANLKPDEILGDNLTGGYIIKVDKIDWDFEYYVDGWKSIPDPAYPNAMNITFQYYYPEAKDIAAEQKSYIRNFITDAENSLTIYYFSNPYLGYQQYLDVTSFIDFMLLSEIPKEVDKYRYSTYFHKDKESNGGKLFAGPAWDFDLGYGNVDYWEPGLDHTGWLYENVAPGDWSIMFWWKRLMEDPYFRDMASSRWKWLRENRLSNNQINLMIDSIRTVTHDARIRNFERWPILGTYVWPNYDWYGNNYEDEVYYFKNFLFPRLQWMDDNLTGNQVDPKAGISLDGNTLKLTLYGDYFADPILKKTHFQLNNAPTGVGIENVYYDDISNCHFLLTGDAGNAPDLTVTISEKEINYWLDVTSNPLSSAGVPDAGPAIPEINVFHENHQLHIRMDHPDLLPDRAEVYNITGQHVMNVSLVKTNENVVSVNLKPGLYFLIINLKEGPLVAKFPVSGY
jgi:hypothetical protein